MKSSRVFLSVLAILLCSSAAVADPPTSINVDYKVDFHVLMITVNHPTDDPSEHYIEKVTVAMNGRLVYSKDFNTQTNYQSLAVPVIDSIMAKPGDVLIISAFCNKGGGALTVQYIVPNNAQYQG